MNEYFPLHLRAGFLTISVRGSPLLVYLDGLFLGRYSSLSPLRGLRVLLHNLRIGRLGNELRAIGPAEFSGAESLAGRAF